MVLLVFKVLKVNKVLLVFKEKLVQLVLKETLVLKVTLVLQVFKEKLVQLVLKEILEQTEKTDHLVELYMIRMEQ